MLLKYNDIVYHDEDHYQMLELADDVMTDLKDGVLVLHIKNNLEALGTQKLKIR